MRYFLAVIFICAAGVAAAAALPPVSPRTVSVSKAGPIVHVAKHNRSEAQSRPVHRRSRADSGIHPLVGSGNY